MDTIEKHALEIFERIAEFSMAEQQAYLDEQCPDTLTRERVEAMLRADARAPGLLDDDAEQQLARLADDDTSRNVADPDTVGSFRIIARLGEGGMAVVYKAERSEAGFDQTVALKLLSQMRRSEHWQHRFLQERQILASLQHPNIAALLDGGITAEGRPFFAMEYVDGEPITGYCDRQSLGIRRRVELLLSVCDAVSYAHSNLIVHRDLKPSNILVDQQGQAKLLDFGIAKILSDDETSRTQTMLRALTPDYAAPEQFAGGTVTTAVDVYALGGLLFELLCGSRPYERAKGSVLDIEREIHRRGAPSFAEATADYSPATRGEIAGQRNQSWRRLTASIDGDLETIAQKSLRVEPERRYASVDALANDLRRYLNGLPVQARPDTLRYRFGKFLGRHPIGVPLGVIAVAALAMTTGVAVQQARQAEHAANLATVEAAKANETREFVTRLFEFAGPDKSLGDQLTARQLLDIGAARVSHELAGQPALHAEMALLLANTYGQLGLYATALPLAQEAADLYGDTQDATQRLDALLTLARLHRYSGNFDEAQNFLGLAELNATDPALPAYSALLVERGELAREQAEFDLARAAFQSALTADRERSAQPADIARDLYRLGTLEFSAGDNELGLSLLREAASHLSDADADNTTQHASIQHDIGVMLIQRGDLADAQVLLTTTLEARQRLLGERHPDVAGTYKELAGIARQMGDSDTAESLYLQALGINEVMLGPEHPETANNLNSLAVLYRGMGRDEQALSFATRALRGATTAYGASHPTVGLMTVNVGAMQRMVGELDAALASTNRGLAVLLESLGTNHHLAGVGYNALAGVQHDLGDHATAESNYRRALEIFEATAGPSHPHVVSIRNGLGNLLADLGRTEDAEPVLERALEVANSALPVGHPNVAVVNVGLARVAALRNQCERALKLWQDFGATALAATSTKRIAATAQNVIVDRCP